MAVWLRVLILPMALLFFTNFASSPDSDTPAGILIYFVFITFLEKIESDNTNSSDNKNFQRPDLYSVSIYHNFRAL